MSPRKLNKQQRRRIDSNHRHKLASSDATQSAVVVAHMGYQIIVESNGKLLSADWRKQIGPVAVNDRVLISHDSDDHCVVEGVFPRKTVLSKWQGRKTKPLASNIDQLLITIAIEPEWQSQLIDRFLIAATEAGVAPGILVNKMDLLDQDSTALEARLAAYRALNVPVFFASVKENRGVAELNAWFEDKQTLICGQSGVGKSSLIRHLVPNADIWVQAISQATGLGRHTTTNLRRYPLDHGAIIDTPGVRGFAIVHLDKAHILAGFPDILPYSQQCRFNDCQHQQEPGCAVCQAVKEGKIPPDRYASMMQLLTETTE